MAYQEFYCNASTGSNLNGGSPIGGSYPVTQTGGTVLRGGGVGGATLDLFTAAAGTPFSGCAAGDWVSIYADGAAAPTAFIARIVTINAGGASFDYYGTGTLSSTIAYVGTRPTDGTNNRTAVVGGAWKGPTGASGFPFGFITSTAVDASGNYPRVNFLAGTYSVSAAITHNIAGPVVFSGYETTVGDGHSPTSDTSAKATIAASAGAVVLTVSAANNTLSDFIFTGGTSNGLAFSAAENAAIRCVSHTNAGSGFSSSAATACTYVECEAYANTAGGFSYGGSTLLVRCIAHDNTTFGFSCGGSNSIHLHCVADTNTTDGFITTGVGGGWYHACDSYANGGDNFEINVGSAAMYYLENCNAIGSTGGWGFRGVGILTGAMFNCGTQGNSLGATTGLSAMLVGGAIAYAAQPYKAPTTGDFRLALSTAITGGRGQFTQTQASYAGLTGAVGTGAAAPRSGASAKYGRRRSSSN